MRQRTRRYSAYALICTIRMMSLQDAHWQPPGSEMSSPLPITPVMPVGQPRGVCDFMLKSKHQGSQLSVVVGQQVVCQQGGGEVEEHLPMVGISGL